MRGTSRGFTLIELLVCLAITALLVGAVVAVTSRYHERVQARHVALALDRQARLLDAALARDALTAQTAALAPGRSDTLVLRELPPILPDGTVGPAAVVTYAPDPSDPTRLLRAVRDEGAPPETLPRTTTAAVDVAAITFAHDPQRPSLVTAQVHLRRTLRDHAPEHARELTVRLGGAP